MSTISECAPVPPDQDSECSCLLWLLPMVDSHVAVLVVPADLQTAPPIGSEAATMTPATAYKKFHSFNNSSAQHNILRPCLKASPDIDYTLFDTGSTHGAA